MGVDLCVVTPTGRTHDTAFVGGQRLRADRPSVRPNFPTGKQIAREIRRVRRLRGRAKVRASGQQLHVSRSVHAGHPTAAHEQRTVSVRAVRNGTKTLPR